jgi:putative transposase
MRWRGEHHELGSVAATKLLFLVLRQVAQTWKMPPREWCEAKTQFAIMFDDRFVKA